MNRWLRSDAIYSGDPLWWIVLSEIRTNLMLLAPSSGESCFIHNGRNQISHSTEYEYLLSQIEDALEISKTLQEDKEGVRNLRIAQLTEDLAEAYSRRFKPISTTAVSILVDPQIPTLKSYPSRLMRIIDCLIRRAHKTGSQDNIEIVIKLKDKVKRSGSAQVGISCHGIPFAVDTRRLNEVIDQFHKGSYARFVRDLGLELCCAFHIARQMGAEIVAQSDGSSSVVELLFPLQSATDSTETPKLPGPFYYFSKSPGLRAAINSFASFYNAKAVRVNSPAEVPAGSPLVFDATDLSSFRLDEMPRPAETVLIIPFEESTVLKELALMGFNRFAIIPLVSSKLIRCLLGDELYTGTVEEVFTERRSSLRILVVDDTATARILLRDQLEARKHTVVEATDGLELVNLIKQGERFDLVFCDLNMCHLDGDAALKLISEYEDSTGHKTPVVLMTAYTAAEEHDKTREEGFDYVMNKPINSEEIEQVLLQLVPPYASAKPVPFNTQIIDLKDLRLRCAGRPTTMIRVLESFIESSRTHLSKLRLPEVTADPQQMAKTLHALKGLLRDTGAKEGAAILEQLEQKYQSTKQLADADITSIEQVLNAACKGANNLKQTLSIQPPV